MRRTRMRAARRLAAALTLAFAALGTSGATVQAADPAPTAITAPSSSANPSVWCQPVTLTARVTAPGAAAVPSGFVTFADGGKPLGDRARVDGSTGEATLTTGRLGAGTHAIDASFEDSSGRFAQASSDATLSQRVVPATTTTTLTSSQNPAVPGTPVTLTALVSVNPPADARWLEGFDGALRFSIDGAPFGPPLPLQGRYLGFQVTLAYRAVPATYALGVSYSGDANSGPSSAVLAQVVQAAPSPPPAGGAPAAPSPPAASAQPQLATMSGVLVRALRRVGLAGLTRTTQPFSAPAPGVLEQKVYSPDTPASSLRARATRIASARRSFAAAGRGRLRLKATRAGRRAIAGRRSLKLAIVTRFTPSDAAPVTVVNRLTVKATARSRAFARAGATGGLQVLAIRPTP